MNSKGMIVFSGAPLDRAAAQRRQTGWVEERRADPRARAVLMSDAGVLLADGQLTMEPPGAAAVFLGLRGDTPLFAEHVGAAEPDRGRAAGFREAARAARGRGGAGRLRRLAARLARAAPVLRELRRTNRAA